MRFSLALASAPDYQLFKHVSRKIKKNLDQINHKIEIRKDIQKNSPGFAGVYFFM